MKSGGGLPDNPLASSSLGRVAVEGSEEKRGRWGKGGMTSCCDVTATVCSLGLVAEGGGGWLVRKEV